MAKNYLNRVVTPAVAEAQRLYYGRSQKESSVAGCDPLGPDEEAFIRSRDSFYMATVTETGWPYLQHRGGPPGFLRVLDARTLAFADYKGNRQLLSTGNLTHDDRVSLFLMDYVQRQRLKILGHARVADARVHSEALEQLIEPKLRPVVERIFIIDVVSFDWNCPKYITPRYTTGEVEELVGPLKIRIAELEAELSKVKNADQSDSSP
ncbi:MAG TPA: pyridoxamine 5'-phosphate oxidase family protein [Terrimicrobium sp.]